MTRNKTKNMQNQLTIEISQIFNLCYEILSKSDKQSLVYATLETLLGVLSWIPSGYILETDIVKILVTKVIKLNIDLTIKV
jgi:exportin-1